MTSTVDSAAVDNAQREVPLSAPPPAPPPNKVEALAPQFFSLSQRLGRVRYFTYTLVGLLSCSGVLLIIYTFCMALPPSLGLLISNISFTLIKNIVMPMIVFVMTIRRLHDVNVNGWWSFLVIIPFLTVILLFVPGSPSENRYGLAPAPNSQRVKAMCWMLPLFLFTTFAVLYKSDQNRVAEALRQTPENQPELKNYRQ